MPADINTQISDALGERLLEIVRSEEFTPGWGQVILRFVKDNGGVLPQPGELMDELRESLPFKVAE
tara:strand:- start:42 stop:239 length:198 start_codon:yes stop_codon:yes gene_type:complete